MSGLQNQGRFIQSSKIASFAREVLGKTLWKVSTEPNVISVSFTLENVDPVLNPIERLGSSKEHIIKI